MDENDMVHKYSRGSTWRKWDLHIHTPISICQKYGGAGQWDKFIDALERLPEEVKVIGITDYYFIDGYEKVMEYKTKGRLSNLEKIFPILEFRIDTFGSGNQNNLQKINLHILFDVDESILQKEIKKIKDEFISQIPITKLEKHKTKTLSIENLTVEGGNDLQNGFSSLIPPTDKVFDLILSPTWRDKTFLFLGYKEWSNLEKNNQLKPLKEDLYDKVSAFFTNNLSSIEKSQNWLNELGQKRLLYSGDIHDFEFLDTANKDENEKPVKSINYKCETWIKSDPTFQGLKQIIFEPKDRVRIQEADPMLDFRKPYFNSASVSGQAMVGGVPSFNSATIPLNPGMIALIGGRGTGKSVLLDCIYKLFKDREDNKDRINDINPDELTVVFSKSDGANIDYSFNNRSDAKLDYLHVRQGEIKEIARKPEVLNEAIKKLLGIDISSRAPDYDQEISVIINRIEKSLAWFSLKNEEGQLVNEREHNENVIKSNQALINTITTDQNKVNIEKYQNNRQAINGRISAISRFTDLKTNLTSYKLEINREIEEVNKLQFDIKPIPIIDFAEKELLIDENIEKLRSEISGFDSVNKNIEEEFRKQGIDQDVSGLLKKIAQYQREIDEAKEKIIEFDDKLKSINEDVSKRVDLVERIVNHLQSEIESIDNAFGDISAGKGGWSDEQKSIVDSLLKNITIKGEIHFNSNEFYKGLSEILNGSKFRATGTETQESRIRSKFNVTSYEDYIKLLRNEKIISNGDEPITINEFYEQKDYFLRGSYNIYQYLYLYVYRKNYLNIQPVITYLNKPPSKLSVGQRGTFYVCMKLATDPFGSPFVFDQPEDDLDNDFIMKELVPIFRQIKKYRQVIIATHNANLVVNADAEQVIVAKNNDEVLSYTSGSIENTNTNEPRGIRERICDILEGGDRAFMQREKRYAIKR